MRVQEGTWLADHHPLGAGNIIVMTKETCGMSSTLRMHAVGSRAIAKTEIGHSKSGAMRRDYDLHDPYYDHPTWRHSPVRARDSRGIKPFLHDLRKVICPPNFKPLAIDKYNGSTNLVEWLKVHQLVIRVVGGDSYVMANCLSICLSSSART
jgi:hypothetical protein